jgi:hypothetical protein
MNVHIEKFANRAQETILEGEKFLNKCGYVPFLSTFSGQFRALVGVIQAVAFGILSAYTAVTGQKDLSKRYFTQIVEGFANIFRGFVETFFIVGNVCCFIYDQSGVTSSQIGEKIVDEASRLSAKLKA